MNMQSPVPASPPTESEPQANADPGPTRAGIGTQTVAQTGAQTGAQTFAHSAFVPLLLGSLALLVVLGYQTFVLVAERSALNATHSGQQQTVDNATKLRNSLDALAADTQRLADAGNPNAGLLVAELRKRGISINPQGAASAAAGAAAASAPR